MALSKASPSACERLGRKALSLAALGALEPPEAAAYFVVRRSEGLTRNEQQALKDWLAATPSHRGALANAERVWRVFDEPGDDQTLRAMRAHALASRSRSGSGWRRATLTAAIIVLFVGILLSGPSSDGRLSMRRQRATDRL